MDKLERKGIVSVRRDLDWDGCRNVRDLGGLPLPRGSSTRFARVVRSDNPARLTPAGWEALYGHGVRTVILLRTRSRRELSRWTCWRGSR